MSNTILMIAIACSALATSALSKVYPETCHVLVNPTRLVRTSGTHGPFFPRPRLHHLHRHPLHPRVTAAHDNHTHTVSSGTLYFDPNAESTTIVTEHGLCAAVVDKVFVMEPCDGGVRQEFAVERFLTETFVRSRDGFYPTAGEEYVGDVVLGERKFGLSAWTVTPCHSILVDATQPDVVGSLVPSAAVKASHTLSEASSTVSLQRMTQRPFVKTDGVVDSTVLSTTTGVEEMYGVAASSALLTTTSKGDGKKVTMTDNLYESAGAKMTGVFAAVVMGVGAVLFF
ncbi:hypothetical protein BC829DRAFT_406079 [Chytridium lagenaria]|nr:hypothetical protein BC829DRAFT_406079 [Chytridium lagenaria]